MKQFVELDLMLNEFNSGTTDLFLEFDSSMNVFSVVVQTPCEVQVIIKRIPITKQKQLCIESRHSTDRNKYCLIPTVRVLRTQLPRRYSGYHCSLLINLTNQKPIVFFRWRVSILWSQSSLWLTMGYRAICRVLYDFTPSEASQSVELTLQQGDLLYVLGQVDDSNWLKARKKASNVEQDEPEGIVPQNYVTKAGLPSTLTRLSFFKKLISLG